MGKNNKRAKKIQALQNTVQEEPTQNPHCLDTTFITYLWLLFFSLLMFTLPFLAFYGVYYLGENIFGLDLFQTNCYAAISSVVVTNCIVAIYAYKAWHEEDDNTYFRPRYLRVNTHMLSMQDALQILDDEKWRNRDVSGFEYTDFLNAVFNIAEDEFIIDMHVDNLLIFHPVNSHYWACHKNVQQKKMLLQDKGTSLVVELLRPPACSVILDMCAAPGMKTIHLSNALQNTGTIYAVEQNAERYKVLCQMVLATNCTKIKTINSDALTITSEECTDVEYILVDPSCSGSGMQNRMSLEPEIKNDARLYRLQGLQIKLLSHAMKNFPNVKRIAYSTCSLYEEENEQVVQRCLEMYPDFKLLSGKKMLQNKWKNTGNSKYQKIGKKCLYARPETDFTNGIFIAIFEKLFKDEK